MLQWLHLNGCRWNQVMCSFAAKMGHLAVLQWADRMAAVGMRTPAPKQLQEVTWQSCSGRDKMAAAGMRKLALLPLMGASWQSCSGHDTMAAAGMRRPAPVPLPEAIWQC